MVLHDSVWFENGLCKIVNVGMIMTTNVGINMTTNMGIYVTTNVRPSFQMYGRNFRMSRFFPDIMVFWNVPLFLDIMFFRESSVLLNFSDVPLSFPNIRDLQVPSNSPNVPLLPVAIRNSIWMSRFSQICHMSQVPRMSCFSREMDLWR